MLTLPTFCFGSQHTSTLQNCFILILCHLSLQLHLSSSQPLPMAWVFCSPCYINLRLRSCKESHRDRTATGLRDSPTSFSSTQFFLPFAWKSLPFPPFTHHKSNGYGSLWFFINWNIQKFLPTSHKAPVIASPRSSEEKTAANHLLLHKNITQYTFPSETPFAKNNDRSVMWATKSAEQSPPFPLPIKTTGNSL